MIADALCRHGWVKKVASSGYRDMGRGAVVVIYSKIYYADPTGLANLLDAERLAPCMQYVNEYDPDNFAVLVLMQPFWEDGNPRTHSDTFLINLQ